MTLETAEKNRVNQILLCAMVLGLLLRLIIAFSYPGFLSDLNLYRNWAIQGAKDLWGIYHQKAPPDYPPLYLYILAGVGKAIWSLTDPSQTQLHYVLIKLPSMIFDLLLIAVVLSFAKGRRQGQKALFAALLLLFNPVLIINSSLWGQTDAFYGCFVLLFLLGMARERFTLMMVSFGLLVLFKPTGLFLLPVVILEGMTQLRSKRGRDLLKAGVKSLFPCLAIILPFLITMGLPWLISLYVGGAKKYGYASQRAPNLMVLLEGDLKPDSSLLPGGLSYLNLSIILLALFGMFFAWLYFRYPQSLAKPALLLLWFSGIYMLSVRMHERYNYVQILLAAVCMVIYKEKRFLGLFTALSVIASVNHFSLVYFSNHQETRALWLPFLERLTIFLALLNMLAFLATIYITVYQLRHFSVRTLNRSA